MQGARRSWEHGAKASGNPYRRERAQQPEAQGAWCKAPEDPYGRERERMAPDDPRERGAKASDDPYRRGRKRKALDDPGAWCKAPDDPYGRERERMAPDGPREHDEGVSARRLTTRERGARHPTTLMDGGVGAWRPTTLGSVVRRHPTTRIEGGVSAGRSTTRKERGVRAWHSTTRRVPDDSKKGGQGDRSATQEVHPKCKGHENMVHGARGKIKGAGVTVRLRDGVRIRGAVQYKRDGAVLGMSVKTRCQRGSDEGATRRRQYPNAHAARASLSELQLQLRITNSRLSVALDVALEATEDASPQRRQATRNRKGTKEGRVKRSGVEMRWMQADA
ncbi:hypothetical protein C8J57DRAFT_1253376 [Mycena rebaudengoi]|nr:hypothetical protein C8J57DRAFT_1253376 [Mycena rebaudengoi]